MTEYYIKICVINMLECVLNVFLNINGLTLKVGVYFFSLLCLSNMMNKLWTFVWNLEFYRFLWMIVFGKLSFGFKFDTHLCVYDQHGLDTCLAYTQGCQKTKTLGLDLCLAPSFLQVVCRSAFLFF